MSIPDGKPRLGGRGEGRRGGGGGLQTSAAGASGKTTYRRDDMSFFSCI